MTDAPDPTPGAPHAPGSDPAPATESGDGLPLVDLLREAVARGASDVHLHAGAVPHVRIDGDLRAWEDAPTLTPATTEAIAMAVLPEAQRAQFAHRHELDFAFTLPDVARFRCNVYRQRGSVGLALRVVQDAIPGFEALGLPVDVVQSWAERKRGLVLVTGPTGSGKTTSLAAMLDHVNRRARRHVITIEDPIEFLHTNRSSLVVQREVGLDTADFADALKYAMRQDPDVLMIGEMRDKATVEAALTAAQTGHLVLSTLHTLDAVRTIYRIVDFFAPFERDPIRAMLSESLLGVLSQRLLPRADGAGRALATEVLVNTPIVRDAIRDPDKTSVLREALQQDNLVGMHPFDASLVELYLAGTVTLADAAANATSPHELRLRITQRVGSDQAPSEREVERLAQEAGPAPAPPPRGTGSGA